MTAIALPSQHDIRRYARGALISADAVNVIPAPLEQIAEAARLQPAQDLFALGEDAPPGIRDIMRKLRGKVMGVLAFRERTIYVDLSLGHGRRRFVHAHEIGHDALPWHERAYLADDEHTLSTLTRDVLEREANAFAAELLFGIDRFSEECDAKPAGLAHVLALTQTYEASMHAGLRRYVERSSHRLALLALGRIPVTANGRRAHKVIRAQCVQSDGFMDRYGLLAEIIPDRLIVAENPAVIVADQMDGGVSEVTELRIPDTRRGSVTFDAEIFDNRRLRFILIYRRNLSRRSRLQVVTSN